MKKLFYLVILSWLIPQATPACAQSVAPAAGTLARGQITKSASVVFLGRALQGEFYKDISGRIYHSAVVQILEVLRGGEQLKAGTVEVVNSMEQTPELEAYYRLGSTRVYSEEYAVYFAEPSTNPPRTVPYQTSNGNLILQPVANDREAIVTVKATDDATLVHGLHRGWASEEAMLLYVNGLPGIKPLAKVVNSTRYPLLRYRDQRFGGRDIYAPEGPGQKDRGGVGEGLEKQQRPAPVGGPVQGKSLPLEAFEQLPAVMRRIQFNEPLSKQDSAFIKRYIPEQMPGGARPEKRKGPF